MINLVRRFLAGHFDLVCVDYYDEITGINVGRILSLVLATQARSYASRHATEGLAFGVNQQPVLAYFVWFRAICLHQSYFGLYLGSANTTEATINIQVKLESIFTNSGNAGRPEPASFGESGNFVGLETIRPPTY